MNLPKKGSKREDGLVYLGHNGVEWTDEKTFRRVANEQYRLSACCSYVWRAALSFQVRQEKKRAKLRARERAAGMPLDEFKRLKHREACKKSYMAVSLTERRIKTQESRARTAERLGGGES